MEKKNLERRNSTNRIEEREAMASLIRHDNVTPL